MVELLLTAGRIHCQDQSPALFLLPWRARACEQQPWLWDLTNTQSDWEGAPPSIQGLQGKTWMQDPQGPGGHVSLAADISARRRGLSSETLLVLQHGDLWSGPAGSDADAHQHIHSLLSGMHMERQGILPAAPGADVWGCSPALPTGKGPGYHTNRELPPSPLLTQHPKSSELWGTG